MHHPFTAQSRRRSAVDDLTNAQPSPTLVQQRGDRQRVSAHLSTRHAKKFRRHRIGAGEAENKLGISGGVQYGAPPRRSRVRARRLVMMLAGAKSIRTSSVPENGGGTVFTHAARPGRGGRAKTGFASRPSPAAR